MRAPERTMERAKALRRSLTPPEARLWTRLSRRQLDGLLFRKQHPLGPYVLDFYCSEARLAVEVDGLWHETDQRIRSDQNRDAWLRARGVTTLRVPADAVRTHIDVVLEMIRTAARERSPLCQPADAG